MDNIRPSNRVFCFRWECPNCKYVVGFLPTDLELPCPRCDKGKAKEFSPLGYGPLDREEGKNV
jgi:hypothetical protein